MPELSVIIVTKNEANNIGRCLESVKWAAEIVVVDSGSTDNTVAICQQYTDRIYQTDWPGFGQQKNRALDKATKEWVLSLDADEELSPALVMQIKQVLTKVDSADAYELKRQLIFLGKVIRYACGSDRNIRLFKRVSGRFTDDVVHERVMITGRVDNLTAPCWHYSFRDLNALLDKMNHYSFLGAKKQAGKGKRVFLLKAISHGWWTFARLYFISGGFLDGRAGFILAVSFAHGTYYRYLKLMYLQKKY